jgi:hypothetical protein
MARLEPGTGDGGEVLRLVPDGGEIRYTKFLLPDPSDEQD